MKFISHSWGLAPLLLTLAASLSPLCRADSTTMVLDGSSPTGGDYTGTLTVNLSAGDWTGANWAFGNSALGASVAVPGSSNQVNLGLQLVSGTPGQLYISGAAGAAGPPPGAAFVAGPADGATGPTSTDTALAFQTLADGFYVPMSWDGDTDSWYGSWQVKWSAAASVPDAPATAGLFAGALVGLAALQRRWRRARG